jgi:hypothetical protein
LLHKVLYYVRMTPHTSVWKWVLGLVVVMSGLAVAIPLGRFAEQDDAPGGVFIAFLIFVGAAVLATRIVSQRPKSTARK